MQHADPELNELEQQLRRLAEADRAHVDDAAMLARLLTKVDAECTRRTVRKPWYRRYLRSSVAVAALLLLALPAGLYFYGEPELQKSRSVPQVKSAEPSPAPQPCLVALNEQPAPAMPELIPVPDSLAVTSPQPQHDECALNTQDVPDVTPSAVAVYGAGSEDVDCCENCVAEAEAEDVPADAVCSAVVTHSSCRAAGGTPPQMLTTKRKIAARGTRPNSSCGSLLRSELQSIRSLLLNLLSDL